MWEENDVTSSAIRNVETKKKGLSGLVIMNECRTSNRKMSNTTTTK